MHRHLEQKLRERFSENKYRRLSCNSGMADFCSNDYLGFARSPALQAKIRDELGKHPGYPAGATGSRLLSGNSTYAEHLEEEIALFHHAQAGLIFNSGYAANLGLFSAIARRGDTVICDELAHASIIDGIRLSGANRYTFSHNDTGSLEQKLKQAEKGPGRIFIAVESIYSMDGDKAPLEKITSLTEKHNAALIVDEAHAGGIFGKNGRGLVPLWGLEEQVFARIYTFGKALGSHGAIITGSKTLKDYLVNFARPLIYTTALPFHNLASIKCAYELLIDRTGLQKELDAKIALFKTLAKGIRGIIPMDGPIQTVTVPGNKAVREAAGQLQASGLDVRPILSPTVPEGKERIRICLHLYNTEEEIKKLTGLLTTILT
ncbi:8-amino-7-oxononanoate synthase [Anseongella ginsenosidimutans]|nr:8-amino-7-oxononanoate synthase [Anseongella ginsenosidimutans]